MNSLNCNIKLLVLWLGLANVACKQPVRPETTSATQVSSQTSMSKGSPNRPRPSIPPPVPIAPGSVQVLIEIEELLPPERQEKPQAGTQRAQARIVSIIRYGAGVNHPLSDGQKIKVYFPGGMQGKNGERLKARDKIEVNLQVPLQEQEAYTVNEIIGLIK